MKKKSLLYKIKSKYIFQIINRYIRDETLVMKLFTYSKYFQKKLNFSLDDYIIEYLQDSGLDFKQNILKDRKEDENEDDDFGDKNICKDILKGQVDSNIDFNNKNICRIITKFYEEQIKKNNNKKNYFSKFHNELEIYLESPIIKYLSKSAIFSYFSIFIPLNKINKYYTKYDFTSFFNELNNSNCKYQALTIDYDDLNDINIFEELKIDFNKITKLKFNRLKSFQNIDIFEEQFFVLDNIQNLMHLEIYFENSISIKSNILKNLGNLKLLKFLYLENLSFEKTFLFNLHGLEILSLSHTLNIILGKDSLINLTQLILKECYIVKSDAQPKNLKLPKLISLYYRRYVNNTALNGEELDNIIDYQYLDNLKDFTGSIFDFILLRKSLLENVKLISFSSLINASATQLLEKVISRKSIKKISFGIYSDRNDLITKIKGENATIKELNINYNIYNNNDDINFYEFQNKFPNLLKISIKFNLIKEPKYKKKELPQILIKSNPNCKTNEISLFLGGSFRNSIEVYCTSFENLIKIDITLEQFMKDFNKSFPLFSDNCNVIFKSLRYFKFYTNNSVSVDYNIIKNLYNNLNYVPNLKELYLKIYYTFEEIEEDLYKNFISKILSMNLDKIIFEIGKLENSDHCQNYYYSFEALKKINPNIIKNRCKYMKIMKYNYQYNIWQ